MYINISISNFAPSVENENILTWSMTPNPHAL